jgi:phosphatidylglycerol---prolipoprotein diacylglyceryl transferase
MAYDIAITFVHPLTVGAVLLGSVLTERFLPLAWPPLLRWGLAVLAAVAVATGAVLLGMLPGLGQVRLALYTVFMLGGFFVAWWLLRSRMAALGLEAHQLRSLVLVALICGILGARFRYVYERWDALVAQHGSSVWWVALDLDRGGAVWYGGMTAAAIGVLVGLRWYRVRILPAADLILPATLVGLGIGRIGCFFNGCCFGGPTAVPWAVACPRPPHGPVHPTQIYEAIVAMGLGLALWAWWRKDLPAGTLAAWTLIGYGAWRFINESLRGDHDVFVDWPLVGHMTTSQGTSVVVVMIGFALLIGILVRSCLSRGP